MKEVEEITFNGGDKDEEEEMVVSCSSSTYFTPAASDEGVREVEEKAWQLIVTVVRDPSLKEWQGKGESDEEHLSDGKSKQEEDMEHKCSIPEDETKDNSIDEAMVQRGRSQEGGDRRERKTVVSHVTFEWSGKVDKDEVENILQQEVG